MLVQVIETVGRDASNIRSVLASHSPVTSAPLTVKCSRPKLHELNILV
jgi:hypothetical protein